MAQLDGRVALVTGGSKGLRAATACLFAESRAQVVITFANDAEAGDKRVASSPLKRIGRPEEVAAVILGLATKMTFVNGTVIPVDGGKLL